jgi:hypothetical protein
MKTNKKVWKEEDFESMNWHDCKVYGIGFDSDNFRLIFDIDYILEWIKPENNKYFKFWVSPSSLIFKNVYDLSIDISITDGFEICKILRENPNAPRNKEHIERDVEWSWRILQSRRYYF